MKYINNYKIFEKNLLIPRNVEGRKEKQLQMIYRLLQQDVIDGDLDLDDVQITNLGKVKRINGELNLENNKTLKSLDNLEYVKWLSAEESALEDLGNLKKIEKKLYLRWNKNLKSLGKLEIINGDFWATETILEDLGNLKKVNGYISLKYNKKLKSLGNLEYVGGELWLEKTNIEDLGNLKECNNILLSKDTKIPPEQYKKFNYEIV